MAEVFKATGEVPSSEPVNWEIVPAPEGDLSTRLLRELSVRVYIPGREELERYKASLNGSYDYYPPDSQHGEIPVVAYIPPSGKYKVQQMIWGGEDANVFLHSQAAVIGPRIAALRDGDRGLVKIWTPAREQMQSPENTIVAAWKIYNPWSLSINFQAQVRISIYNEAGSRDNDTLTDHTLSLLPLPLSARSELTQERTYFPLFESDGSIYRGLTRLQPSYIGTGSVIVDQVVFALADHSLIAFSSIPNPNP